MQASEPILGELSSDSCSQDGWYETKVNNSAWYKFTVTTICVNIFIILLMTCNLPTAPDRCGSFFTFEQVAAYDDGGLDYLNT